MRPQRLRLRPEHQRRTKACVIQRLLAEAVADQRQLVPPVVPRGDGEHAETLLHRGLDPPDGKALDEHFRIRVASKRTALRGEFTSQLARIVDLAIEHDHEPPARRRHRLMTGRREVHDRQPLKPKSNPLRRIAPHPVVIRPAMPQGRGHASDDSPHCIGSLVTNTVQESGQAAHACVRYEKWNADERTELQLARSRSACSMSDTLTPFDHRIKQVFESGDSGLHRECLVHPQPPCRRSVAPSLAVGEAVFNRLH